MTEEEKRLERIAILEGLIIIQNEKLKQIETQRMFLDKWEKSTIKSKEKTKELLAKEKQWEQ